MSKRWLLPDGVEEILPQQALKIEQLRRQVLDLYQSWGFQFVIPPLLEFSESFLAGLGDDMSEQTVQFGDRMSSRLLALRADITPQIARIDAHSLAANTGDDINRLCYVGTVVKNQLSHGAVSRTPIYAGAELYGDESLAADCEVILLMLESLTLSGLKNVHLDLGHVEIYRQLVNAANISLSDQDDLFDAIQRKAQREIDTILDGLDMNDDLRLCLSELASLHGDESMLAQAREILQAAPASVIQAIDDLENLAQQVRARCSNEITFYFDLSELRSYGYHSGLVFSALVPGLGRAVAKGGRYDHVGEVFGRARPATGFQIELKALTSLIDAETSTSVETVTHVVALDQNETGFWQAVQDLRKQGTAVVCTTDEALYAAASQKLVLVDQQWQVK